MITIEEYRNDPCKALSVPYWKAKNLSVPPNMKIVHDSEYDAALLDKYNDRKYFRLMHHLKAIPDFKITKFEFSGISTYMIDELSDMINLSYAHSSIGVTADYIRNLTTSEVYCPELWIGAFYAKRIIGSVIGEFDRITGEAVIEWLQVLPEYRNSGIASALVCRVLKKMCDIADFATVSGECGNPTNPEYVYRKCGFEGSDIWHILESRK
ncbi:MAG: GNAT family N-acetyltransferase [Oscillospiraceae bacterium]|nr:GNAT family N-acetyltransferase [Oscillospiraceae bacterium]